MAEQFALDCVASPALTPSPSTACFSPDGSVFALPCASRVVLVNAHDGLVRGVIDLDHLKNADAKPGRPIGTIVGVATHPIDNSQFVLGTSSARLYVVGFYDPCSVRLLPRPSRGSRLLVSMQLLVGLPDRVVVIARDDALSQRYGVFSIKLDASPDSPPVIRQIIKPNAFATNEPIEERQVAFGPSVMAAIVTNVRTGRPDRTLFVHKITDAPTDQHACYHVSESDQNTMWFTCVAVHVRSQSIAVGCSTGLIMIWNGSFLDCPTHSSLRLGACTNRVHWHSGPVTSIRWSPHASSLYSGGMERVFVRHVLHSQGKWSREFVPRLGAAIRWISLSADGQFSAVLLVNDVLHVIDGRMRCVAVSHVVPIRAACLDTDMPPPLLVTDRWAKCVADEIDNSVAEIEKPDKLETLIVTNALPGQLQCMTPADGTPVTEIDITSDNVCVGAEMSVWSEVVSCAFSADWMATLVCCSADDQSQTRQQSLSFWRRTRTADGQSRFELNTRVEFPHEGRVTMADFCDVVPDEGDDKHELSFITTGIDGDIKIWMLTVDGNVDLSARVSNSDGVREWWCLGERRSFRSLPAECGHLSHDQSALAVAFANQLTLWNTSRWTLITSLAPFVGSATATKLRHLCWCPQRNATHLLLCTTRTSLLCLDTRSLCPLYVVQDRVHAIVADPVTGIMAAAGTENVTLWYATSSQSEWQIKLPVNGDGIARVCFAPTNERTAVSPLFVTASDNTMFAIRAQSSTNSRKRKPPNVDDSKVETPFARLLIEERTKRDGDEISDEIVDPGRHRERMKAANVKMLSAPAHALPSLTAIAPDFIRSFLLPTNPS